MNYIEITTILSEGIIFLSYIIICIGLTEFRFSKKTCLFTAGGILTCIALVQAALFLSGQDTMFIFTILPITAYLPAAVGLYILSQYSFLQTTVVWAVGILSALILNVLNKIFLWYFGNHISGWKCEMWSIIIGLFAAALFVFLIFWLLYRPFHVYVKENRTNCLRIFFPVLMIVILFSYFKNNSVRFSFIVCFLLLLTALSLLAVIARLLMSSAAVVSMKETEKAVEFQMKMQRQEYEDVCKKMEAGSIYRHDMRHHLLALEELAKQGDIENVLGYLEDMKGSLSKTEREVYCENITVNAVLSSCIRRARDLDCVVFAKIDIPKEIPYDDIDICMVLANAIENAVNACQKINEKKKRYIRVTVKYLKQQRLIISVENSCAVDISFDEAGYPDVLVAEGHGIGLKSIHAITDKYNGCLRCECSEGEFRLHAALFCVQTPQPVWSGKQESFWKKLFSGIPVSMIAFFILTSCVSVIAQASAKLGSQGEGVSVWIAEEQSLITGWGGILFKAEYPVFASGGDGERKKMKEDLASEEDALVGNDIEGKKLSANHEAADETTSEHHNAAGEQISESGDAAGEKIPQSNDNGDKKPYNSNSNWNEGPANGDENDNQKPSVDEGIEINRPSLEDMINDNVDLDNQVVEDLNDQIDGYINEIRSKFLWYVARKYNGHVGADIDYQILRNDSDMLVVQFFSTINAGGSGQYSRNFVLDKKNGKVLELSDLFLENSNYCSLISKDILRQMKEQMKNGKGNYFVPGGIWSEDECFKEIAEDQNFYINMQGQLVIVFDEYEVAPGSMGSPEFVIDTNILKNILQEQSLLR